MDTFKVIQPALGYGPFLGKGLYEDPFVGSWRFEPRFGLPFFPAEPGSLALEHKKHRGFEMRKWSSTPAHTFEIWNWSSTTPAHNRQQLSQHGFPLLLQSNTQHTSTMYHKSILHKTKSYPIVGVSPTKEFPIRSSKATAEIR